MLAFSAPRVEKTRTLRDPRASLRHFVGRHVLVAWLGVLALTWVVPVGRAAAQSTAAPSASAAPATTATPTKAPTVAQVPYDRNRTTPRRMIEGFLRAGERGDWNEALDYLDTRSIPQARRTREAPELARMLYRVLTWRVILDASAFPDESPPELKEIVLDNSEVDGVMQPITIAPVRSTQGVSWLFTRETVGTIREMYDAKERRWLEDRVPESLKGDGVSGLAPWQWIGLAALFPLAYAVGRLLGALASRLVGRLLAKGRGNEFAERLGRPLTLALGSAFTHALSGYLLLPVAYAQIVSHAVTTLYIVAGAWALLVLFRVAIVRYQTLISEEADLDNRGLITRLEMVRRIGTVLVTIVATGLILLQFTVVRTVGLSLLASAGIAGVLVGFAAQRTLGGIISGVEVSITQPLRIGDLVVIDGHFGSVERMFFTYVVLKLWDERRLIVPMQRIMNAPFENWTRTSIEILAPVEIYVDYTVPIADLRTEFERLCRAHPAWDERVCRVQVVEATDKALRVRGIASCRSAEQVFDMRCDLRERWITYVNRTAEFLPKGRVISLDGPDSDKALRGEPPTPESRSPVLGAELEPPSR